MTDPAPALENLPNWPRWLNARWAAAYLGVSTGTFHKEQEEGLWPGPGRGKGKGKGKWRLWDRCLLDIFSNRLSKISTETGNEENGYGRDPGYIKRRLEAAYGNEEHPALGVPAGPE